MKKEQFKELIEIYRSVDDTDSIIKLLSKYILELEERVQKLEAKDFTRNEPLIGGDY